MTIEKALKIPDLVEKAEWVHSVWKADGGVRDFREWKANGGLKDHPKSNKIYQKCFTNETFIRSVFGCESEFDTDDDTVERLLRKYRKVEKFVILAAGRLQK